MVENSTCFEDFIWKCFEEIEPEEVHKKRKKNFEDAKLEFDDLPQFAQAALIKMQQEINLLEGLVTSQKEELMLVKQQLAAVTNINNELHKTIAVLGAKRLSPKNK